MTRRLRRHPSGAASHLLEVPGDGASPAVLFLHGVGGGAWSWEPQAAALAHERRCYVFEARGHGLASRVADAGLGDYWIDANEALDAAVAASGGPVVVAGHSMGGLLGFALADERRADVAGLFLVEPVYAQGGSDTHLSGPLGRVARALLDPVIASYARDGRIARRLSRWIFAASFTDRRAMERAWLAQRTQVPVEYPKMITEAFDGPTGFPNRAFAETLDVRTTILEGRIARERPRFPELIDTLQRRLDDRFRHDVSDGGHYLQLDRPEYVTQRLAEFVRACR